MIPTAYILMYSGLQNPEKELSDEEVKTLKEMVSKLTHTFPGPTNPHLGFSGYSASLSDECYVIASMWGYVQIFDKTGVPRAYSDTEGVLAYLCKLMTPVMVRHYEDAAKVVQQPYFDPTWVYKPNDWDPQF